MTHWSNIVVWIFLPNSSRLCPCYTFLFVSILIYYIYRKREREREKEMEDENWLRDDIAFERISLEKTPCYFIANNPATCMVESSRDQTWKMFPRQNSIDIMCVNVYSIKGWKQNQY